MNDALATKWFPDNKPEIHVQEQEFLQWTEMVVKTEQKYTCMSFLLFSKFDRLVQNKLHKFSQNKFYQSLFTKRKKVGYIS